MPNLDKEINEQVGYIFNQLEPFFESYERGMDERDKDIRKILFKTLKTIIKEYAKQNEREDS